MVVIYGVSEMMPRFRTKLESELGMNMGDGEPVTVMSNTFPIIGWEDCQIAQEHGWWVYEWPTQNAAAAGKFDFDSWLRRAMRSRQLAAGGALEGRVPYR